MTNATNQIPDPPTVHLQIEQVGPALFLTMLGELDIHSAASLPEPLLLLSEHRTTALCLDLRSLEYIDSTGLRWILRLHRAARVNELSMEVRIRPNSHIERVLGLIGAEHLFPIRTETEQ